VAKPIQIKAGSILINSELFMRFKMMAIATIAMFAVPALAQTSDTAPAPKPKKEKKVCRSNPPLPGSNMRSSTCHTKDEWAKIDASGVDPDGNGAIPGARSSGGLETGSRGLSAH
jgi:hypothetical protein